MKISIKKVIFSIKKLNISIEKANIFIKKLNISIKILNISIEKMKKLTVFGPFLRSTFSYKRSSLKYLQPITSTTR